MRQHDVDYDDEVEEREEHHREVERQRREREREKAETQDRKEVNNFAQDAFKKSAQALSEAELGKTKKIFGLFEVDAGIAAYANTIYNMGSDFLAHKLAPKAATLVERYGSRAGIPEGKLQTAGTLAHIASTIALKAGGYVGPLFESLSAQRAERARLARAIAPVLDEIRGNHSVRAFRNIGESENEIIFAHKKRMAKIASSHNVSNIIDLAVNSGTNLMLDIKGFAASWKDKRVVTTQDVQRQQHQQQLELQAKAAQGDGQGRYIASGLLNTTVPQLLDRYQRTSEHRLKTMLQPYSALEMILELNEQISSNPDSRAFAEPRSYQSPKQRRHEFSLEEYLMRICIQHQKDMADISPDHSEIREALRDDLAEAIKPIAKAIRHGDLSPIALIRLVGEGKIIKKQGRAIASAEDVKALVSKEAPKQSHYVHVDPAEHYKNAAYSRDQFKKTLNGYDGDEKIAFASIFPNSVLEDAGMGKKDLAQVDAYRAKGSDGKGYDFTLAYEVLGLNAKKDEQLEATLAHNEIKSVRDAAEKIERKGVEAIHDLKTSATHENGIESVIGNVLVHKPEYLGTILKDGRKEFAAMAANDDEAPRPRHEHHDGHAKRVDHRRREAANHDHHRGVAGE